MTELDRSDRVAWVRLARTRRIGPVTFARLLQKHGTASSALAALASRSDLPEPAPKSVAERELRDLERAGGRMLCACEAAYPVRLKQTVPPPVLSVLGDPAIFKRQAVAIVGSRNASGAGRAFASRAALALGAAGKVVVSGMARGIDGEAHAASADTGTIAVLAGGVTDIFPPEHKDLHRVIAERGAVVSEAPFGHNARARDFPKRNRIITGLSDGVVVVEAAERSGSLISARTAGEQGRIVMAVPGSPFESRSEGTNRLIRDGAILVRHADDILEALAPLDERAAELPLDKPAPAPALPEPVDWDREKDSTTERVFEALNVTAMPLDVIARSAGLPAHLCLAAISELELEGRAYSVAGGLAGRMG